MNVRDDLATPMSAMNGEGGAPSAPGNINVISHSRRLIIRSMDCPVLPASSIKPHLIRFEIVVDAALVYWSCFFDYGNLGIHVD